MKELLKPGFLLRLFKDSGAEWMKDNAMRLSAALSYYAVFSIAPLIMIAIGVASWFYHDAASEGKVEVQLIPVVGWQAAKAIQSIVESASKSSSGATIVGFVTLLVGASTVFGQLKDSLDTMWEVRTKSGLGIWFFIRERLLTFGMVLVIGLLLLVSLVAATVFTAMGSWVQSHTGIPAALNSVFVFLAALVVESLLFALIYKVLPSAEIDWECVAVGSVFTALLFELGKWGLSLYLGSGSATSPFGAAGSVVLVLLWVYYASNILFFGANITEVYARLTGRAIQPSANAESTELVDCDGNPAKPATRRAKMTAEPHPLTPELIPPANPQRESLAPLLRNAHVKGRNLPGPRIPPLGLAGHARSGLEALHENPMAEVGVALVGGLVIGLLSRAFERKEHQYTTAEHLKTGLSSAAAEGASYAQDFARSAAKRIRKAL